MFNNIKNIYICPYYADVGCTKTVVFSSSFGVKIQNTLVDIWKYSNDKNLNFKVKDSRMNIYIEWTNPNTKESEITRLRVINGKEVFNR